MTHAEQRTPTAPSRLVRFLWWCLILVPVPNLLLAVAVGVVSGREKDGSVAAEPWSP